MPPGAGRPSTSVADSGVLGGRHGAGRGPIRPVAAARRLRSAVARSPPARRQPAATVGRSPPQAGRRPVSFCYDWTFWPHADDSDREPRRARGPVGRRRQGQDRRSAQPRLRRRGPLAGGAQRRAHGHRRRRRVHPAPDPVGHPASRRHLRHRQRRGRRSGGPLRRDRRARCPRPRHHRAPARQQPGARHPAVSPRHRGGRGEPARRPAHRDDVARHRTELRAQGRPLRHPHRRPGRRPRRRTPGRPDRGQRRRAQPDRGGTGHRVAVRVAGPRPASGSGWNRWLPTRRAICTTPWKRVGRCSSRVRRGRCWTSTTAPIPT